jgi:heterodisulfide reductase subunit B
VDEGKACALAARNLAIAEQDGLAQVMAPCSACYLVLNKTQHYMQEFPAMRGLVDKALGSVGLKVSQDTPVRHPLDVLINDVGLEAVKQKVTQPLKGLKVAPYYGCQIVRPYSTFDDQADPETMDNLLKVLGAEVIDWPLKTKCCGGSLTGTLPEAGLRLSYILLKEALKRGANVIATVCPLCQFNLDGYHDKIEAKWQSVRIPTVYFSQLMGLAFGMPANRLGLQRGFIPMPALPKAEAVAA